MGDIITARLTGSLNSDLATVAKTEHLDKSTVIRRLLSAAVSEWKKDHAVRMYASGRYSAEQAAEFARISLWSFFDLLREKKMSISYDADELEREIRNIKWKQQ